VQQSRVEVIDQGLGRREADLRGRLENDQSAGNDDAVVSDGAPVDEPPADDAEDYQLDRALDLLRGVAMFGARSIQ
jgi:carboxyl-terminal processing protease